MIECERCGRWMENDSDEPKEIQTKTGRFIVICSDEDCA